MEEFERKKRLKDMIEVNIKNMEEVKYIVLGIMGIEVLIKFLGMKR